MKQSVTRATPKDLRKEIQKEQETIKTLVLQAKNTLDAVSFSKYEHLLSHITECTCHKYQADGVACGNVDANCHECERALEDLTCLLQGLKQDFKK